MKIKVTTKGGLSVEISGESVQKKEPADYAHEWTDERLKELEKRIAAEYKKAADELTDKIDAYFESFKKRDEETKALIGTIVNGREYTEQDYRQWRLAQIGRGKRFEALRDRIAERMTHANEVAAAYINDKTAGIYSLNRNYAAYAIEQVAGDVGFDLWDEQTVKRLIVEQPDLMPYYPPKRAVKRGIDLAWGKRQITAQVTSGILQGESIKHLADRLQTNIPNMNRDSAIRAARTAVTGAQNAGRQDSYDAAVKMGIEMEKQWLATLDSRTRHDHAMADGQTVAEDKPFNVGGYKLMFPGDMASGAPGHLLYNCRCTMIAKVKGVDMSDAKRRARDPETGESALIENMTYEEWTRWKKSVAPSANSGIIDVVEKATGAKQGAPMSILDAATGANPGYMKNSSYKINCQRCVQTYEMRRRGYDVIAKPKPASDNAIVWGSECFIQPGEDAYKAFSMGRTAESIKKEIASAPDGARYAVYVKWKGRNHSAHVFIAEKDGGAVRYLDPQTGKDDVEYYFSSGRNGKFGIFRFDDKNITTDESIIAETMEVL